MDEHNTPEPEGPVDLVIFYAGAVAILGLFGAVLYGVGARYLFNRPPLWSVDVPNLIFIWLVFGAVGLTTKLGPQIRVVFFVEKMPASWRRGIPVASHAAILVMLAFFIWYSAPIITLSSGETMLSTGWSGALFFYALPAGCLVMGYYQLRALFHLIRR